MIIILNKTKLTPLTTNEIRPEGWIKRQLEIQAAGLSGHLDKMWPYVKDSRWIGGDNDGWELVPYWLDGFIPLAYLLDNSDMKRRAKYYIDSIISRQQEDGWLCPCDPEERAHYDIWAAFLICKVLALYGDCSNDERIIPVITNALKQLSHHIDHNTLFNWGAARWFEALIPIFWLYERIEEDWLLDFAQRLEIQGFNYNLLFDNFRDKRPERRWTQLTHVVNLAMCLKQGALTSRINGKNPDEFAELALKMLNEYHSMANGHFAGDECLSGDSPIQGTELCGVVEAMYSYENLFSISGNPKWGDVLEKLAFNALPATISEDMWTHQYLQMTNQVQCSELPHNNVVFRTNSAQSHLFGLEPNYCCCTGNFNQGWPKLVLSAFMKTENGLASTVLIPSTVTVKINDVDVTCSLTTDYPFKGNLKYKINCEQPCEFAFSIRIPKFASKATVDGAEVKGGEFFKIHKTWSGETTVDLLLDFDCELVTRPRNMNCLWRGPLLYSLPIKERFVKREYESNGVIRKHPYCDYEIYPESDWNYGFTSEKFSVTEHTVSNTPFSHENPPITINTELIHVDWPFMNGVCAKVPSHIPEGNPTIKTLIPYGCTNLRITEMPFI